MYEGSACTPYLVALFYIFLFITLMKMKNEKHGFYVIAGT